MALPIPGSLPQITNDPAPNSDPTAATDTSIEMSKVMNPSPNADSTPGSNPDDGPLSPPVGSQMVDVSTETTANPTAASSAVVVVQESAVLLLSVFSVAGTFAALYHQAPPNVRPWFLSSLFGFVVFATLSLVGKYLRHSSLIHKAVATFLMIAGAVLAITFVFVTLALVLQ